MSIAKVFYNTQFIASGSQHLKIDDTTTTVRGETGVTVGIGWTSAKISPTRYSQWATSAGGLRSSATFVTTPAYPDTLSEPDNTTGIGDSWRTGMPLNGTFATGNWIFRFDCIATAGSTHDGRIRLRIWKSSNPTGAGATEITSGAVTGTTVTNLTTVVQTSTVTWNNSSTVTLDNEYLFFQIAWEIVGAGNSNSGDINYRMSHSPTAPSVELPAFTADTTNRKVYYITDDKYGSGINFLQLSTTEPTSATSGTISTTGWTVGTNAAGNDSPMQANTTRASTTFGTLNFPTGSPDNFLGDSFRTPTTLTGNVSGTWVFRFGMGTNVTHTGTSPAQRLRMRIWKSANTDGTSATELTAGSLLVAQTNTLTSGSEQQMSTVWVQTGSVYLDNDYLFFQMAAEAVTACTNTTATYMFRIGEGSRIDMPAPVVPLPISGSASIDIAPVQTSGMQYSGRKLYFQENTGSTSGTENGYIVANEATRAGFAGAFVPGTGYKTGWIVGTGATGYSSLQSGQVRLESTFGATALPEPPIDGTLKDAIRMSTMLSGTFASGTWALKFPIAASGSDGATDGRIRMRLYRADGSGSNATELTTEQIVGTTATNIGFAIFASTASVDLGPKEFNNEYIFAQLAWERTGAGLTSGADVCYVFQPDHILSTPAFTPAKIIYYFRNEVAESGSFGRLWDSPSQRSDGNSGFTIDASVTANQTTLINYGAISSSWIETTNLPTSSIAPSGSNSYITPVPLSGTFLSTDKWVLRTGLRGNGNLGQGLLQAKLWRTTNLLGENAIEFWAGNLQTNTVTITSGSEVITRSEFSLPSNISFNNEYIAIQLAYRVFASTPNTGNVVLVTNESSAIEIPYPQILETSISGSTTVAIAPIAVVSSGEEVFTGTTTEAIASTSIASSGELDFSGTATNAVSPLTISAIGEELFTGATTFDVSATTFSSLGTEEFSGTASEAVAPVEISVTGFVSNNVGDATIAISAIAESATGEQDFAGTISESLPTASISAEGTEIFAGTTEYSVTQTAITSNGEQVFTGTTTEAIAPVAFDVSGTTISAVNGSATYAVAPLESSITGQEVFTGTTALAISPITEEASGEQTFAGTSTFASPPTSYSANGEEVFTGTGSEAISPVTISADGLKVDNFGETTLAAAPIAEEATGTQLFTGTTSVAIATTTVSSTGTEEFTGTITETVAPIAFSVSGTSFDNIAGTAEIAVNAITEEASGLQVFTGTIDESIAAAAISANGQEEFTGTTTYAVAPTTISGEATELFTGTTTYAVAPTEIAVTGVTAQFVGAAQIAVAQISQESTGVEEFTGTATEEIATTQMSAAGDETFTGTTTFEVPFSIDSTALVANNVGPASVSLSALALSALGDLEFDGIGTETLSPVAFEAAGLLVIDGTATFEVPFGIESAADQTFTGIATQEIAPTQISAITELVFTGIVSTTAEPITVEVSALESFDGAVEMAIASLVLAGAGAIVNDHRAIVALTPLEMDVVGTVQNPQVAQTRLQDGLPGGMFGPGYGVFGAGGSGRPHQPSWARNNKKNDDDDDEKKKKKKVVVEVAGYNVRQVQQKEIVVIVQDYKVRYLKTF